MFNELRVMGTHHKHGGEVDILRHCMSENLLPEENAVTILSSPGDTCSR